MAFAGMEKALITLPREHFCTIPAFLQVEVITAALQGAAYPLVSNS